MQTPRLLPSRWAGALAARGLHRTTAFALAFAIVAALGCEDQAPTEVPAPSASVKDGDPDRDVSTLAIALPVNQDVTTTAPSPGFQIIQRGTGPNGIFQIFAKPSIPNSQTALQGITNSTGRAGFFQINRASNTRAALQAETNGHGAAVHGIATGEGIAGRFENTSPGNGDCALCVSTAGTWVAAGINSPNRSNREPALSVAHARGTAVYARGGGDEPAVEIEQSAAPPSGGIPDFALRVFGATSRGGAAALFGGNVSVSGTLTKTAGSFRIDHPLDPEHKYLSHSFVESPDMMNVYNGNAVLDAHGRATVELPEYFEALNRDFRYQLTAIGAPGPNLYIAEGVKQNRFRVAGGRPYAHVSWQVTGVRQDAYANAHRIPVEEDKPRAEEPRAEKELVARR